MGPGARCVHAHRRTVGVLAVLVVVLVSGAVACSPVSPGDADTATPPARTSSYDPSVPKRPATTSPETEPTPAPSVPSASWVTAGSRLDLGGCPAFPDDHVYHATITDLPVHPRSAAMIAATEREDLRTLPNFSASLWEGSRRGIPYNVIDGTTVSPTDVILTYSLTNIQEHRGVPLPENPRIQGWPGRAWDQHMIVVDTATCISHEFLNVRMPSDDLLGIGGGRWYADAGGRIDLRSTALPDGRATASGISLLAGMVRFDEVAAGRVDHALSVVLHQIKAGDPVWPATSSDGRSDHPDAMPMGTWLRLRSDVPLPDLGPQASVVAAALQTHGAIVTDTGPGFIFQGDPDIRWDDDDIDGLRSLRLADFEVVDASSMMSSPDSHQLRSR